MCNNRFCARANNLFLESLGPPPSKQPGCGAGNGKVVVGELEARQVAAKDRLNCHANLVRLWAIHLGKQMAQFAKHVLAVRGFGSGPSGTSLLTQSEVLHGSWTRSPPPPARSAAADLFLAPFSWGRALLWLWERFLRPLMKHLKSICLERL